VKSIAKPNSLNCQTHIKGTFCHHALGLTQQLGLPSCGIQRVHLLQGLQFLPSNIHGGVGKKNTALCHG
jgi:hypothetical protein